MSRNFVNLHLAEIQLIHFCETSSHVHALTFCPVPVSRACTNSLVSAYGMTSKIKILFSSQNIYFGTALSGKLDNRKKSFN
jgi:hypothetical protein